MKLENSSNAAAPIRHILPDLSAMQEFAARIATGLRIGDVLALHGQVGAGKTTLARYIIQSLGYLGEIPSPSFTLIQTYDPPAIDLAVTHADFYRLEDPAEAEELALDEYMMESALIAEWPENIGGFGQMAKCLNISLKIADEGRIAIVEGGADWLSRLP